MTSVLVFMYAEMEHDTSSSKDRDIKSLDFAGFKDGQETFQTPIATHIYKRKINKYIIYSTKDKH